MLPKILSNGLKVGKIMSFSGAVVHNLQDNTNGTFSKQSTPRRVSPVAIEDQPKHNTKKFHHGGAWRVNASHSKKESLAEMIEKHKINNGASGVNSGTGQINGED